MAAPLVGKTLGKYKIVEELGQGGMATVYLGYQEDVSRHVAVKVLPPHPGQSTQFVERFRLEARTIARLQHPHILPLYDYGVQDDILYLVTPYIEGGTLRDRIETGPLPLAEINHTLQQLASALDYAHKNGVIHRDIKPGNVLVSAEGNASLADFGIVRMVEGGSGLTATDGVIGTPAYMSPEQGQGLPVDTRSDIYSLGVVVYEMLSGELPYAAETPMQILLKHISEPLPSIHERVDGLPAAMEMVLLQALSKDPEARYQTAGEFASNFADVIRADGDDGTQSGIKQVAQPLSADIVTIADQPSTQPVTQLGNTIAAETTLVSTPAGNKPGWLIGGIVVVALLGIVIVLLLVALTRDPVVVMANATNTMTVAAGTAVSTDDPLATAPDNPSPTLSPTEITVPAVGTVHFATINQPGDTINLQVAGLPPSGDDLMVAAWLTHSEVPDQVLALGRLSLDAFGDGLLSFTDAEGGALPALYNQVLITQEDAMGDAPAGVVVYRGDAPASLTTALHEILVMSGEGQAEQSLLAVALAEADFAARHAGLASGAGDIGGLKTHTEHTLNILLGAEADLNGDGRGQNPGMGLGLVPTLDLIDQQLAAVVADSGTPLFMMGLENMRVCVLNVRQWAGEVEALGREILILDDFVAATAQAELSTQRAADMVNGVDLNNNGQVEAFEGECGLAQIADYGVLAGNMTIEAAQPAP